MYTGRLTRRHRKTSSWEAEDDKGHERGSTSGKIPWIGLQKCIHDLVLLMFCFKMSTHKPRKHLGLQYQPAPILRPLCLPPLHFPYSPSCWSLFQILCLLPLARKQQYPQYACIVAGKQHLRSRLNDRKRRQEREDTMGELSPVSFPLFLNFYPQFSGNLKV